MPKRGGGKGGHLIRFFFFFVPPNRSAGTKQYKKYNFFRFFRRSFVPSVPSFCLNWIELEVRKKEINELNRQPQIGRMDLFRLFRKRLIGIYFVYFVRG
jgi:hypothetical protein